MSDTGQRHNPMPAESLRVFAQSVHESGISEDAVERMIKQNPWDLLDLGPLEPRRSRSRRPTAACRPSLGVES